MATPLIMYSTNTWLAYAINENFYGHKHFVWCSPFKGPGSIASYDAAVPPSSSPFEIYRTLLAEARAGDRGSSKIRDTTVGLRKGVAIMLSRGVISASAEHEILAIIEKSETRDFRPLLYVIPYRGVSRVVTKVTVDRRAHPLSDEYTIIDLDKSRFDVIELPI